MYNTISIEKLVTYQIFSPINTIKYNILTRGGSPWCVRGSSYIHGRVDLGHGLVVQGELVDLDPVTNQLAHNFDLKLVQLALTDGVSFGDDWDDVDLQQDDIPT